MDATEILTKLPRVDASLNPFHRKGGEKEGPLHFHWKNVMGSKAAKRQGEECRIEDAIGKYVESSLSCS